MLTSPQHNVVACFGVGLYVCIHADKFLLVASPCSCLPLAESCSIPKEIILLNILGSPQKGAHVFVRHERGDCNALAI